MMNNEKKYQNNSFNNSTNNSSFENIKSKNSFQNISNKATPIQFGFNFYFDNIKSSPFMPMNSPKPQYFKNNSNNNQKIPISFIFKTSLEKSGYIINPEQIININENFNEFNKNNSSYDDINYYCIPINNNFSLNNSGIINNIYPTITKVTNVQMITDMNNNNQNSQNSKDKNNFIKFSNKVENMNNNKSKINYIIENKEKEFKKDNKQNIVDNDNELKNKKTKIVFECTESDVNKNLISKKFIKKKRFRKNNEQIAFLSKFYNENKNWSKNEIKQMSKNIGLKENKIYKWLWDQKNKEYNKYTKFVINKNNN